MRSILRAAVAALAVVAVGAAAASRRQSAEPTLGTPDQIARDALAVRLLNSAPVQRAIQELEAYYAGIPVAKTTDADWTLQRAARANAMAQAASVANGDPDRPGVMWSTTTAHDWGDLHVPTSGTLLDDPDNVYRSIPIDGAASYVIRGRLTGPPPSQVTFVLYGKRTGTGRNEKLSSQLAEVGALSLDKLSVGRDGRFAITVDASPADGRPNHLQSRLEDREGNILVRDTLADWTREHPLQLSVERVGGPPPRPAQSEAQMAEQVAERMLNVSRYWANWSQQMMLDKPVNTLSHGFARASGWGYATSGHYKFAADEAVIVRLERRGAAYMGFQAADIWGQAAAYVDRPGSLNQAQARPDHDGTYTYVIALADPGMENWIDPAGARAGTFCARWQGLPAGAKVDDAVREIKVVKLADLKRELPAETRWITPQQRAATMRARADSYWSRR